MASNNENAIINEILFLSLNQFIKCKRDNKAEYGIDFSSNNHIDSNDSIYKLKDKLPLSYNDSIHLIYYLHLQQSFLERKGYGFSTLGIEDIIVICSGENLMFGCIDTSYIKKINENRSIVFMSPFSRKGRFCSPEILTLNSIPSSVSYKCFYFSLGALALYCLNFSDSKLNTYDNSLTSLESLESLTSLTSLTSLESFDSSSLFNKIYGTKLYWLIRRIMDNEPNNRILLMT